MTNHIHGPWSYCKSGEGYTTEYHIVADDGAYEVRLGVMRLETVARLVVAAPELLAALRVLADYVETDQRGEGPIPQPTPEQFQEAVVTARAAIAKAEGR